jgi:hypothetical protein
MHFTDEQSLRCQDLADRNQLGTLSPDERFELEAFVTANSILMILKSKARRTLAARASVAWHISDRSGFGNWPSDGACFGHEYRPPTRRSLRDAPIGVAVAT